MKNLNKRNLCNTLIILALAVTTQAQIPGAESAPDIKNPLLHNDNKAIWDLQASFNSTLSANGDVGMAGIAFFNNEFWISRWASDTLYRMDRTGALISEFVIANLTGTRSITTDGTWLYMANNTNTIYRVDPATATLAPPHITSEAPLTTRFATFDPTLDNGAGGFWTGNFNTDIVAINMSGTVLSTIPFLTHTLSGMYGAAYDGSSRETPTLWVFYQGGTSSTQLDALNLPDGTPAGISYDVMPDAITNHSLSSGLAGGTFFTEDFITGRGSLLGLIQGTPDNVVFSYSTTDDFDDAAITGFSMVEGYTRVPVPHTDMLKFQVDYLNAGTGTIGELRADFTVYFNDTEVASEAFSSFNILSGSEDSFVKAYTPQNGTGTYTIKVALGINTELTDIDPENDTASYTFEVSDSTFSRDRGLADQSAGYSIPSTGGGFVTTLYSLAEKDTVTGVWISLVSPVNNDITSAVICNTEELIPDTLIIKGLETVLEENVYDYYLKFANPVILKPGTYAFGCTQGENTSLNLAQSDDLYTENSNFIFADETWSDPEVEKAFFIRPVLANKPVFVATALDKSAFANIYPVPAETELHIVLKEDLPSAGNYSLFDMSGKLLNSGSIEKGASNFTISVDRYPAGLYLLTINRDKEVLNTKIVIR